MKSVAGENSDVIIKGEKLHIQTEDWGSNGATLVSRVFKNGSVIKTFKLPHDKIKNCHDEGDRKSALLKLHQYVIDKIQGN